MRYVLRADASLSIGAGHVMRSSAIAEELISRGEDVVFVGQISDLAWVEARIAALGFSQIHSNPTKFNSNPDSDVLILDSYEIEINNFFITSEKWLRIIAIVDELTPNYVCTLRIHPGLDDKWTGNSRTPILAGPKYIPFRSTLATNLHLNSNEKQFLKIAVVAGGSDPYDLVNEIAKILVKIPVLFEVYLFSRSNLDSEFDSRFHIVQVGQQLDELSRGADLILTTASTSSLEFLARGLCVGVVRAVDNQNQYYKSLGELGVAAQLGHRTSDNNWELEEKKIITLVTSSESRQKLKARAIGLIDFDGASRIVDAITNL
jgi:spore coat polysaccharide biosynthesis predicted glycosyltransferase SpsG